MTGPNQPGAVPHEAQPRSQQQLDQANNLVRRLQQRIAKATQQRKWRKVRALQHLLTRSHSAKILAVERVVTNQGKNTPGVDGVIWKSPKQLLAAVQSLRARGYRPKPLRRLYIPKKNGKLRPLGIPTMRDRAMQALYLLALEPVAETLADPHSYGFRPARSCADALRQVQIVLAHRGAPRWILEGDIQACFDRIDHQWLLDHIPLEKSILRKWLQAGYMERAVWNPTIAGTPQGGIISPVLANLALDGLQARLLQAFPKRVGRRTLQNPKVNLVRYADDFIITGSSKELLDEQVRPLVVDFLAERGLVLSPEKTLVTHIDEGFDFLGQNVRRYGKKVLCIPARSSVKALYGKLREVTRESWHLQPADLIRRLNPKIIGWAAYHRHGSSKATFTRLDHLIFRLVWQWARRRHPQKSKHWITARYFKRDKGNRRVFFGWQQSSRGSEQVTLASAERMRIIRYIKVRSELNFHDPQWTEYLAERRQNPRARGFPALQWSVSREASSLMSVPG